MSSAIYFNLDHSKILSSGNGLNTLPIEQHGIFSFSHNVFNCLLYQIRQKSELLGKQFKKYYKDIAVHCISLPSPVLQYITVKEI